jgi:hypothetical protein
MLSGDRKRLFVEHGESRDGQTVGGDEFLQPVEFVALEIRIDPSRPCREPAS